MVLYDDKRWLCRLIRTAFTLEDDSGICENVLKERPYLGDNVEGDSDSFSSDDSFDIREGADVSHRRRSNTAIRLERLEKQRKAHIETQHVRVKPTEAGRNEIGFARDNDYVEKQKQRVSKVVSIKNLLESVPHPNRVPFAAFARFEATCQPTVASKRIAIFLPFLPPKHRSYPVRVVILATAKISDLIGLTLWVTSQNHPGIDLHPPHHYNLLIADEDGEWDCDFPPLDKDEPVSKFQFSHLALLRSDHIHPDQPITPQIGLSFLLPNASTFQMTVEDTEITIGHLINLVLTNSGWCANVISPKAGSIGYHLEKLGDPTTTFTDMSQPLSQCKCKEFCLVRDGAKSVQNGIRTKEWPHGQSNAAELPTRSDLYPVTVSTGHFNRMKHALCIIWSEDRMDLEFQNKTKSYALSSITGVKFDAAKNRIVVYYCNSTTNAQIYQSPTGKLELKATDVIASQELYHHLNSIIATKAK